MFENETVRKVLFGVLAVALLSLGVWATVFSSQSSDAAVKDKPTAVATVAPEPVTPAPAGEPTLDPIDPIKVAQPLPDAALEDAAQAAKNFMVAYGSFDYRKPAADQASKVDGMVDGEATFEPAPLLPRGPAREQMVADKVTTKVTVEFQKVSMTTTESASFLARITTVTKGGDDAGRHTDDISITMRLSGDTWGAFGLVLGDAFGEE